MYVYIYTYMYTCVYIYIYIYIAAVQKHPADAPNDQAAKPARAARSAQDLGRIQRRGLVKGGLPIRHRFVVAKHEQLLMQCFRRIKPNGA